jgi:hypothetical protein
MADLHSIAHELYGLVPSEFIAARNIRADSADDAELAKDVRALRKPNATAWIVNMVSRENPELLQEVVELGDELRSAQARSDGELLRTLDQTRRRLLKRVAEAGAKIASAHGQTFASATAAGVNETLKAALVDPEAGRAVLGGLLVTGLSAPGFGAVDLSDALATPEPLPQPTNINDKRIERAKVALADAERDAARATKATASAERELDAVTAKRDDLQADHDELAAELARLAERLTAAEKSVDSREAAVSDANRAEAEALRAVEDAEAALDDVEG